MWWRLAGRSERFRVSRRWSASYAGAGYPKTSVSSHGPLSNIERGHQGVGAHSTVAERCVRDAGRLGPPRQPPRVVSGSVCECDLPAESGELAGDCDGDDAVGLAAGVFEESPAGVQSSLRAPGDVDGLG
jgi:hypothetical protein